MEQRGEAETEGDEMSDRQLLNYLADRARAEGDYERAQQHEEAADRDNPRVEIVIENTTGNGDTK